MDLINFIRVLLRRKWLLLAIMSVAVITTFLIARQAPRVYRVSAQLSTGLAQGASFIESTGQDASLQKYEIEANLKGMAELMQSPQVTSLVGYNLILHDMDPNEARPFRSVNELRSTYAPAEQEAARRNFRIKLDSLQTLNSTVDKDRKHLKILRDMDYDPGSIRSGLNMRRIPGTDLLDVEFTGESPRLVAFVVNTLCQEFVRYYASVQEGRADRAIDFFEKMVEGKKRELDRKMRSWQSSLGPDERVPVSLELTQTLAHIDTLERTRQQASNRFYQLERRLDEFKAQLKDGVNTSYLYMEIGTADGQSRKLLEDLSQLTRELVESNFEKEEVLDSLATLSIQLEEILTQFTRNTLTPNVIQDQFNLVKGRIQAEIDREMAREMVRAIDIELRKAGSHVGAVAVSNDPASDQIRQVEIARDDYLLMLSKLHNARLSTSQAVTGSLSQVAFVQPPEKPVPSQTLLLTILSALVSLGIGVLVIFILEYLDTSIKFPSRLTSLTELPRVGSLNRLQANNLDLVSLFSEAQKNVSLETYKQLMRKIRYDISDSGAKRFLLTSTKSGAGKTALMVSLGYSLSLNGKRVLLIDGNFKNNALTRIIGAPPTLEKYLNREIPRRALIFNSVFDGMDVIGCEGGNLSPAEVFKAEAFEQLLADLEAEYDYILIEGPQLNDYSDSRELTDYVQKVMPVFSALHSINQMDKSSITYLQELDEKLLGAILNKVDMKNLQL